MNTLMMLMTESSNCSS